MTRPDDLRLAPSILSADFARLAAEVAEIADVSHMLHVDIMDAHYVPNLTIGPVVVRWLRQVTDLPFDTHLMIDDPRTYAPQFADAGSDSITFHPETDPDPLDLIRVIRETGAQVGVAIRPSQQVEDHADLLPHIDMLLCMTVEPGFAGQAFMPEGVDNVRSAVRLRDEQGDTFRIQVDGGVKDHTVGRCVQAGADTFVAGSAIFGADDRVAAARAILDAAGEALGARDERAGVP